MLKGLLLDQESLRQQWWLQEKDVLLGFVKTKQNNIYLVHIDFI